jgi:hypothetical protein
MPCRVGPRRPLFLTCTFSSCLPDPHRLAVPVRPVVVRAAPALSGVSRFRLPSAPAGSLRRPSGGVLSPPHGHEAPRGARLPRSAPARYDRDGCPLYPGDGGAHPGRMPCPASACRFPAASPCTPHLHPTSGAPHYGASTEVHAIHPSGLPLTCGPPDGTGGPRAFPCAPHPAVTGGARQGGARR